MIRHILGVIIGVCVVILTAQTLNVCFGWTILAAAIGFVLGIYVGLWIAQPAVMKRSHKLAPAATLFQHIVDETPWGSLVIFCISLVAMSIVNVLVYYYGPRWINGPLWFTSPPGMSFMSHGLGVFLLAGVTTILLRGYDGLGERLSLITSTVVGVGGLLLATVAAWVIPVIMGVVGGVIVLCVAIILSLMLLTVLLAIIKIPVVIAIALAERKTWSLTVSIIIGGGIGLAIGGWTHLALMPTLIAMGVGSAAGLITSGLFIWAGTSGIATTVKGKIADGQDWANEALEMR